MKVALSLATACCVLSVQVRASAALQWAGRSWNVTSGGMAGVCAGNPANVSVDSNGYLHLKISKNGDTCSAAEIFTTEQLGFGTYQWQTDGPTARFDPNVVLGFYPYGPASGIGQDGTNEIDIEYSRWGHANGWRHGHSRRGGRGAGANGAGANAQGGAESSAAGSPGSVAQSSAASNAAGAAAITGSAGSVSAGTEVAPTDTNQSSSCSVDTPGNRARSDVALLGILPLLVLARRHRAAMLRGCEGALVAVAMRRLRWRAGWWVGLGTSAAVGVGSGSRVAAEVLGGHDRDGP